MLASVLAELYARGSKGIRLGLEGMLAACSQLGHPEQHFECVHIAGTNGKGSTSAMLEAVARSAGKKTGLYTSPHLCRFAERIRINGQPIADVSLEQCLRQALDAAPELTFFEVATLAAFLAFRDAEVDFAILEVGLGGRLDATNVVARPLATAITSIGLDHMSLLGDTIAAIAYEKAGIAKRGVPLLLGELPPEARSVIEKHAAQVGAPVLDATSACDVLAAAAAFDPTQLSLRGSFQRGNYRLAHRLAHTVGFSEAASLRGFSEVLWPGRYEFVETSEGPYLLDAAHNVDGARALLESIRSDSLSVTECDASNLRNVAIRYSQVLVYGALADKAWAEVLPLLAERFPFRVYTCPKGRAAANPELLSSLHAGDVELEPSAALRRARARAGSGLVVVCGSVYLVGECRALLLGLPMDPPIAM
jgi:dihydrofolate synthase / folylpolyglutamate synthase